MEGILAVTCNNGNASQRCLQDLDKDYSGEVKDAIVRSVHTLCTPPTHSRSLQADQTLSLTIMSSIMSYPAGSCCRALPPHHPLCVGRRSNF